MWNNSSINTLLKKTEHYDKDERYMAISDLCEALKRNVFPSVTNLPKSTGNSTTLSSYNSSNSYNDISTSLSINLKTEKNICFAVLKLLDDPSNDVQAIAVKALGLLLTIAHKDQVKNIASRLIHLILDNNKSDLRDVYAIGLRTLIKTVPSDMGNLVSHCLIEKLFDGIRECHYFPHDHSKISDDITVVCLEIFTELLMRFGSLPVVCRQHRDILKFTFNLLISESHVIRKRAENTIGCISISLSDQLLYHLVERIFLQIDVAHGQGMEIGCSTCANQNNVLLSTDILPEKTSDTRNLIRTMCTVSGAIGHRLNKDQVDRIISLFLKFCDPKDAIAGDDKFSLDEDENDEDESSISLENELRESCFAGFQSFILKCPNQVQSHFRNIMQSALSYMRFDPNYTYGNENKDTNNVYQGGNDSYTFGDEEDFEDNDEYYEDDNDDNSWKVRRSSIRVVAAIVETVKHDISKLWVDEYFWTKNKKRKTTVSTALVERLKEREENCRVDILDCFTRLLSMTLNAVSCGKVFVCSELVVRDISENDDEVVIHLRPHLALSIVNACQKYLGMTVCGVRTKSSALTLLTALCIAPGGIGDHKHIQSVFFQLKKILNSESESRFGFQTASKPLILDLLFLIRNVISCKQHEPSVLKNVLIEVILQELCKAVEDNWYKVVSEALRVLTEIPPIMNLANTTKSEKYIVAESIYTSIQPKLTANDLDQEIKEYTLVVISSLLSSLHESLSSNKIEKLLFHLFECLKNEATCVAAIKSISKISSENILKKSFLNLSSIFSKIIFELSLLLRDNNRVVKLHALDCMDKMIILHSLDRGIAFDDNFFPKILRDVGRIIIDSDLHICHLCLRISISILRSGPLCYDAIMHYILPNVLTLSISPLLQDLALESLLVFLKKLVIYNAIDFHKLHTSLISRLEMLNEQKSQHGGTNQIIANLAKCIALITVSTSEKNTDMIISDLLSYLSSSVADNQNSKNLQIALRICGDLGQLIDLSKMTQLPNIYISYFDSKSEDVKHAAAYGLGRASVKSMSVFLPVILRALEVSSLKKKYLLFSSLHELIYCHQLKKNKISRSIGKIWPYLIDHCSVEEEGIRVLVADCIGSLICLHPDEIIPKVEIILSTHNEYSQTLNLSEINYVRSKDSFVCWTVISSVKFAIASHVKSSILASLMPALLALLRADDIIVLNAALLLVYSAIHHNLQLVVNYMHNYVLPPLYKLATLKNERKIDMGPFKHIVDDALPLRKSVLSIFAICVEKCSEKLDFSAFFLVLKYSLSDKDDIQLLAHHIIISMCSIKPLSIVVSIDTLLDPLDECLKKFLSTTGSELERSREVVKSALRVIITLSNVEGAMKSCKFSDFFSLIRKKEKINQMLFSLDNSCIEKS